MKFSRKDYETIKELCDNALDGGFDEYAPKGLEKRIEHVLAVVNERLNN